MAEICENGSLLAQRLPPDLRIFFELFFGWNPLENWAQFEPDISLCLCKDDDAALWESAVNLIFHEASYLARCATETTLISAVIGCCSHWLRPHQTRWTADGGFAWPSGYGSQGFSRTGQPEHDWSLVFFWNPVEQEWWPTEPKIDIVERFSFRVTLPARTARHNQAAIPATWSNGTPVLRKETIFQIYGFRKQANRWQCSATNDSGARHYELAAEHSRNKT